MPEITMQEAVDQLSAEGKKEWEMAAQRAMTLKLQAECQSLHGQVQIMTESGGPDEVPEPG